jgi:hypothetical protein
VQDAVPEPEPSDIPQETECPQMGETAANEEGFLTIEMPLDGFTADKFDNLCRIVNAKAALLINAFGADELPICWKDDGLAFPWFPSDSDAEHANAYTTFINRLCKTAKEKKRVNAKEKASEGSPRYAMRCFLLSIGMIGPEYKEARKVLLSRLSGSSSFCTKASEERWKAKHTGSRGGLAEALADAALIHQLNASFKNGGAESEANDLAEALADAELIHAVNASFENNGAESEAAENE